MATLAQARQLGARIQDARTAHRAIAIVLGTLRRAIDTLGAYPSIPRVVGVHRAQAARIEGQIARVRQLGERLDAGLTRPLADQIGLAIAQARDLLDEIRQELADARAGAEITAIASEFGAALGAVLAGAAGALAAGAAPLLWIGLAYLALRR